VTFEMNMPKGTAELLGNAVRRIAMTSIESWRPIAFGFEGMQMNMMHIDPLIMEDTTSVLSNLSDLEVIPTKDLSDKYKLVKFTFRDTLTPDKMVSEDFAFVNNGNRSIVNAIDKNRTVTMSVVFKRASGGFTAKENSALTVEEVGASLDNFIFLGSRHAEVENFTFDVVEAGLREERLLINISSKSRNPRDVLSESVGTLENLLDLFKQNLEKSHS